MHIHMRIHIHTHTYTYTSTYTYKCVYTYIHIILYYIIFYSITLYYIMLYYTMYINMHHFPWQISSEQLIWSLAGLAGYDLSSNDVIYLPTAHCAIFEPCTIRSSQPNSWIPPARCQPWIFINPVQTAVQIRRGTIYISRLWILEYPRT